MKHYMDITRAIESDDELDVLKEESEVIGAPNQFFGKMVSAITMKIARQIILG